MRLLFEDCLGYVRHGRTPFSGLATRAPSRGAVAVFPERMPNRDQIVQLLSPRYAAAWGVDPKVRYCMVRTVSEGEAADSPGLLGVQSRGFVARVSERAAAQGITERPDGDEFSPLVVDLWQEPATGGDTDEYHSLRLVLLPVGRAKDGVIDVGTIIVAAPPLPQEGARAPGAAPEPGGTRDGE